MFTLIATFRSRSLTIPHLLQTYVRSVKINSVLIFPQSAKQPDFPASEFEVIDSSQVVVIDLTEKGVGIGIEAGYTDAKEIPIITIAEYGSDISATLRGISQRVILYKNFDDLT